MRYAPTSAALFLALALAASPALAQRYTSARILGVDEGSHFGRQVAVGNLNDGPSDVLIVSRKEPTGADFRLTDNDVHVFFGTSEFPRRGLTADDADLVLSDAEGDAAFGHEIAVGDLNGDGRGDVVVGVPYNNDRVDESGAAYIYCGGFPADATRDRVLYGRLVGDFNPDVPGINDDGFNLGDQVAVGDVNGDGFDDVVVGGHNTSDANHEYHVFLGNAGFCTGPPINAEDSDAIIRINAGDNFSIEDIAVGDVSGDIYADIVIVDTKEWILSGEPTRTSGGALFTFNGAAIVPALRTVSSASDPNDADTVTLLYDPGTSSSLQSVAEFRNDVSLGDLNGDGIGDIAVTGSLETEPLPGEFLPYVHVFDGSALSAFRVVERGEFVQQLGEPNGTFQSIDVEIGDAGLGMGEIVGGDGHPDLLIGGFNTDFSELGPGTFWNTSFLFGPINFVTGMPADGLDIVYFGPKLTTTAPVGIPSGGCAGYIQGHWQSSASTAGAAQVTACNTLFAFASPPPGLGADSGPCDSPFGYSDRGIGVCDAFHIELAPAEPLSGQPASIQFGGVLLIDPNSNDPQNPDYIDVSQLYDITLNSNECSVPECAVYTLNQAGILNAVALKNVIIDVTSQDPEAAVSIARVGYDRRTWLMNAFPLFLPNEATVNAVAYLEGVNDGVANPLRTSLRDAGALPTAQPYANQIYDGTPLDYDGTETSSAQVLASFPVVDWVLVQLRTTPDASSTVGTVAGLLMNDGQIRGTSGSDAPAFEGVPVGSYYVVVLHRNHLAVMSAAPIDIASATAFLTNPQAVYGTNALANLGDGRFGLWAGDGNGDGSILADDRQSVWLPTVGQTGYLPGDFNMDANVLADDRQSLWAPNVGRQSAVPGASLRPTGEVAEAQE